MECPKCHRELEENSTVCPHCHKVIALVCPNCKTVGQNTICESCGYTILTKCIKCGKLVATDKKTCKCGAPIEKSIAYQECESDEFASVTIQFLGLNQIRNILHSQELYTKFCIKLRNLLTSTTKGLEGKFVVYGNTYVINFNKELSFPTSAAKAVRFAIKLLNAFTILNTKTVEEFSVPLNIQVSIAQKKAEDLLKNIKLNNKVKPLTIKKIEQKYLKGMQLIIDQFVYDVINKEYVSDSLFTVEKDGKTLMLYEIILDKYILPPTETIEDESINVSQNIIKKNIPDNKKEDMYAFKVFDINAECKFQKTTTSEILTKLDGNKITSIRAEKNLLIETSKLIEHYENQGKKVLHLVCTEAMQYKPWGLFDALIREYYNLSIHNSFINPKHEIKPFVSLQHFIFGRPRKTATPEDARFAYMEDFGKFLSLLKDYVIVIENFELTDDSTLQTLMLYFDTYKNIVPDFVFITDEKTSLHSRIKNLLRTPLYTEFYVVNTSIDSILSGIKEDASDFISSFYFEKIKENFAGSVLYFNNALQFLQEKNILVNFENKLLIKNNISALLPVTLEGLIRERLKILGKNQNASLILAYSVYLGHRMDFKVLETLGITDVEKSCDVLCKKGYAYIRNDCVYINNFSLIRESILSSMKQETENYLCKNIISKIGKGLDNTTTIMLLGILSMYKEEYLILWKNSQYAMTVGDFDAYLKNCQGFLSLTDSLKSDIEEENIENSKQEVYQNILMALYRYSPWKIYDIEQVLLQDALQRNDEDAILKLSNLMLQGALISSNYADALNLMHNILTRMPNPVLIVDGAVNTKFLLLSLVNIEILFSIGDFRRCIEIATDILNVLSLELVEQITPAGFSKNLFVNHFFDTLKLVLLAKIIVLDNDINDFLEKVKTVFNEELPDKDCLIAVKDFLSGKTFAPANIEQASPYAKIIYLLLQQFDEHKNDYKNFAQNCYQAKLLASEVHLTQFERLCDVLIAYAYSKIGIKAKAYSIYSDVISKSEKSAIFNSHIIAKYFMAQQNAVDGKINEALQQINDSLAMIQKYDNQAKVFYALFEKLFIEIARTQNISSIDIATEEQRLALIAPNGELSLIINTAVQENSSQEVIS